MIKIGDTVLGSAEVVPGDDRSGEATQLENIFEYGGQRLDDSKIN